MSCEVNYAIVSAHPVQDQFEDLQTIGGHQESPQKISNAFYFTQCRLGNELIILWKTSQTLNQNRLL